MANDKNDEHKLPDRREEHEDETQAEAREGAERLGAEGTISGQGRSGGRLAREIGTEDELKRSVSRPAGKTRVTKSKEKPKEDRDLE